VSDNVEVVTETEIRRRQADLLARFPNVVKFKTKPLHVVQAWVGHENPRTTERYWRDQQALDNSPAQDLANAYYGAPVDERSD
jgi:integrase